MVKAKERRVVTVSRGGQTTRILNVAVTDSLNAVCDKVEEQLSLTADSVILYLDKKMDKVLDDDACTWSFAFAFVLCERALCALAG